MSRTRIIKGKLTEIIEGDYKIYSESNITYNAASQVTQNGIKEGIFHGNPEKYETKHGEYIINGYWSSDFEGNQRITEAKIGDKVFFQMETQNIPIDYLPDNIKDKVTFGVFNFRKLDYSILIKISSYMNDVQLPDSESKEIEYFTWDDVNKNERLDEEEKKSVKPYNSVTVTNNKGIIALTLSKGLNNYFINKENLQLYLKSTYFTDISIQLPKSENEFLKIKFIDGDIIFQKASEIHPFPLTFDAKTGDPYYIEVRKKVQKLGLYANKIKGLLMPPDVDMFTKKSYEFAIRRLKAGELIYNDGSIGKTSRLYELTVENIDRNFSEKIVLGLNKGNFKPGVTSRGINQLEAFSSKGLLAGGAKFISKVMPLVSAVMDLSNMVIAVGNKELPPIPLMPPFVTWEVEKISNEIAEFEYGLFFKGLNNVLYGKIDDHRRGISAVETYIEQWNSCNPHARYSWQVVHLSQQTLEKLMSGEINKIERIEDLSTQDNNNIPNCGILVFTSYEETSTKHYIYATFLPEILE